MKGFDELNVFQQIDILYEQLDRYNRKKFRELWSARYLEMMLFLAAMATAPEEDVIDEMAEMHITEILSEPNELTRYAYDTEVYRKRDRAKEAVNAVPGKVMKQVEIDRALRAWTAMSGYYLDILSSDAEIQALKDAGVQKVVRHEQKDRKTCNVCYDADGEIYPIDKIPPAPHLHCRRWFTPLGN